MVDGAFAVKRLPEPVTLIGQCIRTLVLRWERTAGLCRAGLRETKAGAILMGFSRAFEVQPRLVAEATTQA